ncbi:DegT/DnrJ/EryC1/StrS family aminotransferase [Nanoarchaeota archaeon]
MQFINNIINVKSGNAAIKIALKIVKKLGIQNIILADQGGWITYKQFAQKIKLNIIEIKTDYGVIIPEELKRSINSIPNDQKSALLIHVMAGYHAVQPTFDIQDICSNNNIIFILDTTGKLLGNQGFGDIEVASYGKGKLVNLGYGGSIRTKDEWLGLVKEEIEKNKFDELREEELNKKIHQIEDRYEMFQTVRKKIINDLKDYNIIHKDMEGINVIIKFSSEKDKQEKEKQELINYCKNNNYEYVICPKNIKVLTDAISIEVKRLE